MKIIDIPSFHRYVFHDSQLVELRKLHGQSFKLVGLQHFIMRAMFKQELGYSIFVFEYMLK